MNKINKTGETPMLLLWCSILAIMITGCSGNSEMNGELEPELTEIDHLIKELPSINKGIQHRLDSIARTYANSAGVRKVEIGLELVEKYRLFNADSSLYYSTKIIQEAKQLQNRDLESSTRLSRISTLATLGIFSDAMEEFKEVKLDSTSSEFKKIKTEYFIAGRTLYGYLSRYLTDNNAYFEEVRTMYQGYNDSLISVLDPSSPWREFLIGEKLASENKVREAARVNQALLERLDPGTRLYAMTSFQLAENSRIEGNPSEMAYYYAKAAEGDIKAGVRDGLALPMLANYLYAHDHLDQAYRYITVSMQDASNGGMRWRAYAITLLVQGIDQAYQASIANSKRKLMIYSGITTICFLVGILLLYTVYKQRHSMHKLALQLDKKSKMQMSYMGNFISLYASSAERLNHLAAIVDRKLSAGDIEGLRKMMKSGKYLEGEDDEFYQIFDSAFLDMYPDYVEELNKLLRPEEQMSWKKGKPLSPELRIYALVILGVNESTRIAQILRYSVSTVYAYRNRMRNRAADRDNFESNVSKIMKEEVPLE